MKNVKKLIIILACFLFVLSFSACSMDDWTPHGPYHYQTEALTIPAINEAGGRYFCDFDHDYFEIIDGELKKIDLPLDKYKDGIGFHRERNVYRYLRTSGDRIYVATTFYLYEFGLDFKLIERYEISCQDFFVKDNTVFFIQSVEVKVPIKDWYTTEFKHNICSYDLTTKTLNIIIPDIQDNTIFELAGEYYYYTRGYDLLTKLNSEVTSFLTEQIPQNYILKQTFVLNKEIGIISVENDEKKLESRLKINYKDLEEIINLPKYNDCIYSLIKVNGGKVYFATYEDTQAEDCKKETNCICFCRYGKTTLWVFDAESSKLSVVKEFDKGTYLINYDENYVCYYKDGKVYRNDECIKEVDTIGTDETFIVKGEDWALSDDSYIKTTSYFYDDKENFFYAYIEHEVEETYYA